MIPTAPSSAAMQRDRGWDNADPEQRIRTTIELKGDQ